MKAKVNKFFDILIGDMLSLWLMFDNQFLFQLASQYRTWCITLQNKKKIEIKKRSIFTVSEERQGKNGR
jgi:hypothetical protein